MIKVFKWVLIVGLVFSLAAANAFYFRTALLMQMAKLQATPHLLAKDEVTLGPNESWFDDYFTIEPVDPRTFAISEPRYFRDVYSYLLIGDQSALLIDSASPLRDVTPVVRSLMENHSNVPVRVIATHLHFDHVGNHARAGAVVMPDVAGLRAQSTGNHFLPTPTQHVGFVEGFEAQSWPVASWWQPETKLDLGGRSLTLLHTPGHTPESISIWEPATNRLFMGDQFGDGEIYAFMPNSSLHTYLNTTATMLDRLPPQTQLFAGHGGADTKGAPVTNMASLEALRNGLIALRDGKIEGQGFWPRAYPISNNTVILTDWQGPGSPSWDFE